MFLECNRYHKGEILNKHSPTLLRNVMLLVKIKSNKEKNASAGRKYLILYVFKFFFWVQQLGSPNSAPVLLQWNNNWPAEEIVHFRIPVIWSVF